MTGEASNKAREEFEKEAMPYVNSMYAVALRFTGNDKEAEDLVQDALLRGFRFFDHFVPGTNIRAWLMKIMTNIFLNGIKRSSHRPTLVEFETFEDLIGEVDLGWSGVSASDEGFREYLDDAVANALDELPSEYRVPVLLSAIDGLSYKEIAEAMRCPVGTVMSRLYRGRRMLERRLLTYARETGFLKGRDNYEGP